LLACAELLGGMGELAKHLGVTEKQLAEWVAGRASPPPEMLLKAVDPIIAGNRKPNADSLKNK
jgi:DNA-binding transcriptional regulator YdaS (Cro superfamily)